MDDAFSLTPVFSPVIADAKCKYRFNGLSRGEKPLKRLAPRDTVATPRKPGVN